MKKEELLNSLSAEEREELLTTLQNEKKQLKQNRRQAYESLRHEFAEEVKTVVKTVAGHVKEFRDWLDEESEAFRKVMEEYGQLKNDGQQSYTLVDDDFRLEVKSSKVKRFDERADMAAKRLMDYLEAYIAKSEKGVDDPMYQLAMSLLERNRQGDLDYKSISKLYELEDKFDAEYGEIMELFRESNIVMATAVNYYFSIRDEKGIWRKIEPSFCRL